MNRTVNTKFQNQHVPTEAKVVGDPIKVKDGKLDGVDETFDGAGSWVSSGDADNLAAALEQSPPAAGEAVVAGSGAVDASSAGASATAAGGAGATAGASSIAAMVASIPTSVLIVGGVGAAVGIGAAVAGGGGSKTPHTQTTITSDGGGASAALNLAENTQAVTTVVGTADAGETRTYTIVGGADQAKFAINSSTGALTFVSAPDYEAPTDAGTNNVYDVVVQVSDGSTTATQAIAVTVTGVNESPVISSNGGAATAATSVLENTTAVATVVASDQDAGSNLTYSIVGGADQAKFAIDHTTGVLTFVSAPNYEAPTDAGANNVYDVVVQVSDGVNTDAQAIAVTVGDVAATTMVVAATASVAENATAVTTVSAVTDTGSVLTYSIVDGADQARFAINPTTGALTFVSGVDFEAPSDSGTDNVYNVTVQADDGSTQASQAIAVTVTGVNDNSPVFTSLTTQNVAENTMGTIYNAAATDADSPAQTLTYSLSGTDAALFTLSTNGALSFNSAPDYEAPIDDDANNTYELTITANDGAGLTTSQNLVVTVTGVNDNSPVFTSGSTVSMTENSTRTGYTAAATDADVPGQTLTYSLSGTDASLFAIDPGTGVLTFNSAPNYEAPSDGNGDNVYSLTITAGDGDGRTTSQDLAVTVTGVNDNSPVFTSSTTQDVAENTTGTIYNAAATDADSPAQTLTYSLSGTDAELFTLSSSGALSFNNAPDYEVPSDAGGNHVYDLTITANDGAGRTTSQDLAVRVTGVNDNSPVFTSGSTVRTTENSTRTGYTAAATDADMPGQTLTYSLSDTDASLFAIDPGTGVLTFNSAPNYEAPTDNGTDNVYNLTVKATDAEGRSTLKAVAVTVDNANDIAPVFTSSTTASVAENTTSVMILAASDADGATSFTYSIVDDFDSTLFNVNPTTGALTFASAPDFENPTDVGVNNVYNLTVRVSDGVQSTDQSIAVTVTDVGALAFTSSSSFAVSENSTTVGNVVAVSENAITYSKVFGADADLFSVDASTGALTFTAGHDYESPTDQGTNNVYEVQIQANDGSTSVMQDVAVTVLPVNEYNPVFTSAATASVVENTTSVIPVHAIDADLPGQTLTYSVTGTDAARFQINASTGDLTFRSAPDFEAPTDADADNGYEVTVIAADGNGGSTQQNLVVTVTNALDNTPLINSVAIPSSSYAAGETILVTVNFDQAVNVTGSPQVALTIGDTTKYATYSYGSGTTALNFVYTVESGLNDSNGIAVAVGGVQLHGGTIIGTSTLPADLTLAANQNFPGVIVDTTAPTMLGASFVGGSNVITLTFDEAVNTVSPASIFGSLSIDRNPSGANGWGWNSTDISYSVSGLGTNTITLTLGGGPTLASTDVVKLYYNQATAGSGQVVDSAGNVLGSAAAFIGGSGNQTIDLDDYWGDNMQVVLRGNAGNDTLIGTGRPLGDILVDGPGADILNGQSGPDTIVLTESSGYARDTVVIGARDDGDSTVSAYDVIKPGANGAGGFDAKSATIANHDVLSLASNIIAGNASHVDGVDVGSLAKHSITGGILTFENSAGTGVAINQSNLSNALTYLSSNITGAGTTIGFEFDSNSDGSADSLMIFQDRGVTLTAGYVMEDALVQLTGVTGVTLGTSEGANVVQLADSSAADPIDMVFSGNTLQMAFSEPVYVTNSFGLHLTINGVGPEVGFTVSGNGTPHLDMTMSQALTGGDWVFLTYNGVDVATGFSDASGNFVQGGTDPTDWAGTAHGTSANNTIDLSNSAVYLANNWYDLQGEAGDDVLIGSAGSNWMYGGTGADTMTSGGGTDEFEIFQGDGVAVTSMNLGGNGLSNGDTFTFANGVDRITDLATGEGFNIDPARGVLSSGCGWMGQSNERASTAVLPSNGLATNQGFFLVQGTYNTTSHVFTVNTGADTLVMYDGDSTSAVSQHGLVLTGVNLSQLNAYAGSNWVSHV